MTRDVKFRVDWNQDSFFPQNKQKTILLTCKTGSIPYTLHMKTNNAIKLEWRIKHLIKTRHLVFCKQEASRTLCEFRKLKSQLKALRVA